MGNEKKLLIVALAVIGALMAFMYAPGLFAKRNTGDRAQPSSGQAGDGNALFVDVTQSAGLAYRWQIPGPRPLDILQTIGNGCALLDYNNDGALDILLVGPKLALYKGDGHGHFTEVTQEVGLDRLSGHFLGCAVGDYDNDGFEDLYISGYHTGLLLHNEGGKRFTDVTAAAGLQPQPWGTSCAFGDIDNDGKLDLYVANYVDFDKGPRFCPTPNGAESGCAPKHYPTLRGVLYHNEGQGKFREVTAEWGADKTHGVTLGVAFADYEGLGHQSLYVSNDSVPNDLLTNLGHSFQNTGEQAGIATLSSGPYAGMGVDWGDYDNDGQQDVVIGTFAQSVKPVFHNEGHGLFEQRQENLGFHAPVYGYLTFGVKWIDYDNDGWLDLMMTNGHISDNINDFQSYNSYRQPTLLFHNDQGQHLTDKSKQAGSALLQPIVGRGLAIGDFDNDGKIDALVVDSEGAPLLLHNQSKVSGHWLRFKLVGKKSNRDGIGASVTVATSSLAQIRWCHTDGSYLSASDVRVHVGLGSATSAKTVIVRWPSGTVDLWKDIAADQQLTLTEGTSHKK